MSALPSSRELETFGSLMSVRVRHLRLRWADRATAGAYEASGWSRRTSSFTQITFSTRSRASWSRRRHHVVVEKVGAAAGSPSPPTRGTPQRSRSQGTRTRSSGADSARNPHVTIAAMLTKGRVAARCSRSRSGLQDMARNAPQQGQSKWPCVPAPQRAGSQRRHAPVSSTAAEGNRDGRFIRGTRPGGRARASDVRSPSFTMRILRSSTRIPRFLRAGSLLNRSTAWRRESWSYA